VFALFPVLWDENPAGGEPSAQSESTDEKPNEEAESELDLERAKAKISKANSEAQNLRKRLKELEPLAAKAKELEEASKSAEEKAAERASSAETRAQKAESEAARLRVALKKGLTETQAKRLVGETEEELEADADELVASFKSEDDGQEPKRLPRERLRPGATPSAETDEGVEPGLNRLTHAYANSQ
jgi:hypothetical protein